MPAFDDPRKDAAEASADLRGLAHATHTFSDAANTCPVPTSTPVATTPTAA